MKTSRSRTTLGRVRLRAITSNGVASRFAACSNADHTFSRSWHLHSTPNGNSALVPTAGQFVKEQEDAVKDLERTADESKLAKLKEKFGFNETDFKDARIKIAAKNAATAAEYIKQLKEEIDGLATGIQKTTEETKLYVLCAHPNSGL